MAHAIDMSNGKANMAYAGETPWHGLGQNLKQGASIAAWKKAAGMDFEVVRTSVGYQTDDGQYYEMEGRDVLYRNDTHAPLSVATPRYKVVQPGEVLEFFRDLVGKHGMQLETAGCLKGGAVYWALAKTGDSLKVANSTKDIVNGYILLSTACDGSMVTSARSTSVRVVCNNTLTMANRERGGEIRIPHFLDFDAERVKQDLGIAHNAFGEFKENVAILSDTGINEKDSLEFLKDLYYPNRDREQDESAKLLHAYRTLELVEESPGASLKSSKGTLWGLLNGVTFYIDHEKKAADNDFRLRSAWFGDGEKIKNLAMSSLLQRATVKA